MSNTENKPKKKRHFKLRKLIYDDKYLMVVSLILAIIIWVLVSINLSPATTKTLSVPLNVDLTDTVAEQLGISYFDSEDITVQVTISCKKYIAKDISEDDITASLQTSLITSAGYHSVPITVATTDENANFTIDNYYPTSVEGLFDTTEDATFDITLNYPNTNYAADGYVAGKTALSESSVVVSGAKSYISRVTAVVADVDLESNLTESQVVDLTPIAVDANGNAVDYVTVNTTESSITATVPILKVMNLKPSVNLVNGSDSSIKAVKVSYSTDNVEVGALESAGFTTLPLGDISFYDINVGENKFTFKPGDIPGITVLDGTKNITVTVTVPDNYTSKTIAFSRSDIVLNAPEGYSASVSSASTNRLTIIGDEEILNDITLDNISLSCDLTPEEGEELEKGTGEYNISVVINDADGCWAYGTYTISVNIY